jgi:PBP1b-binding outer membrane lipoprotein LpoB
MIFKYYSLLLMLLLFLTSCAPSTHQVMASSESQVKLRSIQTRAFDTTDREKTLRTIIATLQDLGFVVDKADGILGTVSATKLDRYALRMTVTVRQRGETQMLVRANAQYNIQAVEDPEPYQQFFDSLAQAMFLSAHQVD